MRAGAGDCRNAIEKQRDEASLRLSIPLERLLPGDFWAGVGVVVPMVIWSKSVLLGFCAKL